MPSFLKRKLIWLCLAVSQDTSVFILPNMHLGRFFKMTVFFRS